MREGIGEKGGREASPEVVWVVQVRDAQKRGAEPVRGTQCGRVSRRRVGKRWVMVKCVYTRGMKGRLGGENTLSAG